MIWRLLVWVWPTRRTLENDRRQVSLTPKSTEPSKLPLATGRLQHHHHHHQQQRRQGMNRQRQPASAAFDRLKSLELTMTGLDRSF
jgi:hypothetical protein